MAVQLIPPVQQTPIDPVTGDHTPAWVAHHQEIADELANPTGTPGGDQAAAGKIGEFKTVTGSPVSLPNNTPTDIASLSLPGGDWAVDGFAGFNPAATTHPTQIGISTNTVSGVMGDNMTLLAATFGVGGAMRIGTVGSARVNVAAPTTVYLVAFSTFTTSTMSVTGTINARRIR